MINSETLPQSENIKLSLSNLKNWVDKQTSSLIQSLRAEAKTRLETLQGRLQELMDATEKLLEDAEKELAKGSRKTYRRAKLLQKIADTFAKEIEQLTIPSEITGKTLHAFREETEKALKLITQERTKYFRFISPYFIISRRRFDANLKRALDALQDFSSFVSEEYTEAATAENIASQIEKLTQSLAELKDVEKAETSRRQKIELLEKQLAETQQRIESIHNRDEVIALAQIEHQIGDLEKKVKQHLKHLQKPLNKLQVLVSRPRHSLPPEEIRKLDEYLQSPYMALATEPEGYPVLRHILQKLEDLIEKGELKLKKARLQKAKDQLENVMNKDVLISLQRKCKEALKEKSRLMKSGVVGEIRSERISLQEELKRLQIEKKILETRGAEFEKRVTEMQQSVEEQQKRLERVLQQLTGKPVQIIYD